MHERIRQRRERVAQDRNVKRAVEAIFKQPDRPIMELLMEELEIEKEDLVKDN